MAERNSSSPAAGRQESGTQPGGSSGGAGVSTGSTDATAGGMTERLRDKASSQLNTQKARATEGLGTVAEAVRASTRQLREQDHPTLAGYVESAADQIDRLSRGLKNKDVGDLARDAQRFARRRPALFVGSAFAIGFVGARFLKSSGEHEGSEHEYDYGSGGAGYGRERGIERSGPFAEGYGTSPATAPGAGGTTGSPRQTGAGGQAGASPPAGGSGSTPGVRASGSAPASPPREPGSGRS